MKDKVTEKDLKELYQSRKKDFEKARTKRKRQLASRPATMKELLGSYFQSDSQMCRQMEEARALLAWPKYIGEAAAEHAVAKRFRGSTIIIIVSDPLWMQQLILLKNELLKRFQRDFPGLGIRDLYFSRKDLDPPSKR